MINKQFLPYNLINPTLKLLLFYADQCDDLENLFYVEIHLLWLPNNVFEHHYSIVDEMPEKCSNNFSKLNVAAFLFTLIWLLSQKIRK